MFSLVEVIYRLSNPDQEIIHAHPFACEALRAKAMSTGKTPDQVIREALGGASFGAKAPGKRVDRPGLAALLGELDALPVRDARSQEEITDEGWGAFRATE